MKVEFLKEDLTEFDKINLGGTFSTTYEPNEVFMKIRRLQDVNLGQMNCINLENGHCSYIPLETIVIRRKAKVIVG